MAKITEVDFRFPVLGFRADDIDCHSFADIAELTMCGGRTLKENLFVGMELIDADRRRWRVESIHKLNALQPWLLRGLFAFFGSDRYRIDQELEEMEPASLAYVRHRAGFSATSVTAQIFGNLEPEDWDLLAQINAAQSVAEIATLCEFGPMKF